MIVYAMCVYTWRCCSFFWQVNPNNQPVSCSLYTLG